ncbi:hypothetical protein EST38_g1948 [Candolleomyces aberdarensis]|uniref:Copper transport protein 86 n=1 Tax=Candolleomyces aberdarensis TaxID=2316362 RepID=A0A4Q2DUS8_9AGAR|nr:hypothetical protein EST38_g1948 [Candolleomyces aberdarensis]
MADSQPLTNRNTSNGHSSGNVAARVRKACLDFNIQDPDKVKLLAETLDSAAQELQIEAARKLAGADHGLWSELRKLWKDLARFQLTFWDNEEDEDNEDATVTLNSESRAVRSLCMGLAKFTRNLVAGVPENQVRAYENEPELRRLLHYYTSWTAMEDSELTSNQGLVAALWETYLSLPEDQVILMKLLAKSAIGVRICIALLDDMLKLFEADEESEGGKAFNVGYAIFTRLIEEGTVPDLYKKFTMPDEMITPHQTTLLKLVDSYLQAIQLDISMTPEVAILQTHVSLGPFLAKRFFTLSNYAQTAMQRALGNAKASQQSNKGTDAPSFSPSSDSGSHSQSEPPAELDVMLPKVCEALVLVTQCVTTIALEAEEHKGVQFSEGAVASISNMKDFFIDVRYSSQGLIENLVVLREHALFTLHNLLKNNPENQAIVDAISPAAEFDDAGVLKNKFDALKIN